MAQSKDDNKMKPSSKGKQYRVNHSVHGLTHQIGRGWLRAVHVCLKQLHLVSRSPSTFVDCSSVRAPIANKRGIWRCVTGR